MMTRDTEKTDSIVLEVTGKSLPLLQTLLNHIKLSDGIDRVRIEIDGVTEVTGLTDHTETKPQTEDSETVSEAVESPQSDTEPEPDESPSEPPEPEQRAYGADIETKEPTITYPSDPDLGDLPDINLNPGTARWKVAATLYRTDGFVGVRRVEKLLEGTSWECPYTTISSTITVMYSDGLLLRKPKEPHGFSYQLSQLGRDFIDAHRKEDPEAQIRP